MCIIKYLFWQPLVGVGKSQNRPKQRNIKPASYFSIPVLNAKPQDDLEFTDGWMVGEEAFSISKFVGG